MILGVDFNRERFYNLGALAAKARSNLGVSQVLETTSSESTDLRDHPHGHELSTEP